MSFLKKTRLIALLLAGTSLGAVDKIFYSHRTVFMQAFKKSCFDATAIPNELPKKLDRVRQALERLKKSPTIGAPLAEFAMNRGNMLYCTGLTPYNGDTLGVFSPTSGSVRLWSEEETKHSFDELASVTVHETHHGVQYDLMPLPRTSWSIYDAQLLHIFREAGARTTENLFLIDLVQNEQEITINGNRAQKFALDAYNAEISKEGAVYSRALERAGEKTFEAFLKEPFFLMAYNDDVLSHYLQYVDEPPTEPDSVPLEGLRKAGQIADDFNFTAKASMPEKNALFGGSKRMRQAFAYVEYQRWLAAEGPAGEHVAPLLAEMTEDKNPYISIDRKKLRAALPRHTGTAIGLMNKMAGLKP